MLTHQFKGFITALFLAAVPSIQCADLFDPDNYRNMAADQRAFRVGDSVTLVIVENAKAKSSAGTGGEKKFGLDAEGTDVINSKSVSANVGASSRGDASTTRHGFLTAQLSLTVVGKNPYGNLIVSGEQRIAINGEEQEIIVNGVLRPEDIDRHNRALSTSLSSADIQFTGEGTVGSAQSHNIFYNVLTWLGIL